MKNDYLMIHCELGRGRHPRRHRLHRGARQDGRQGHRRRQDDIPEAARPRPIARGVDCCLPVALVAKYTRTRVLRDCEATRLSARHSSHSYSGRPRAGVLLISDSEFLIRSPASSWTRPRRRSSHTESGRRPCSALPTTSSAGATRPRGRLALLSGQRLSPRCSPSLPVPYSSTDRGPRRLVHVAVVLGNVLGCRPRDDDCVRFSCPPSVLPPSAQCELHPGGFAEWLLCRSRCGLARARARAAAGFLHRKAGLWNVACGRLAHPK